MNEIPAIVRDLDDDEAVIIMVDSNLQRENILPVARLDFPLFARFFAVGLERAAQTCVAGQKVRVKFGPYAQYLLSVGILFDLQPLIAFGHGLVGVGIAVRRFSAAARQRAEHQKRGQ